MTDAANPASLSTPTTFAKANALTLVGAIAGGVLGHFIFLWLVRQGFYGLVLPGGLAGLAAGLFKTRSLAICVACCAWAIALGFFTEWRWAPFTADQSLKYFLAHLHQLRPLTLIMIALGAGVAFYVPFRRSRE